MPDALRAPGEARIGFFVVFGLRSLPRDRGRAITTVGVRRG